MNITLQRQDDAYHFVARNETGNSVSLDGSPSIGGGNKGARPMELMLMGLGGCSGIDIVSILKKGRQEPREFDIEIDADRDPDHVPSLFTNIRVRYIFSGDLDPAKVRRAIELSLEKYCSVAKILERTASITYTYTINGETYGPAE
jgi:putative redox protein